MDKNEAKTILMDEGRYNLTPEKAYEICKIFGVSFDEKLVRTTQGYRESIADPSTPRVSVSSLSKHICLSLGKKPDEKKLDTANTMMGEGSHRDLLSQAYAMNL